jgi:hypothetical protein
MICLNFNCYVLCLLYRSFSIGAKGLKIAKISEVTKPWMKWLKIATKNADIDACMKACLSWGKNSPRACYLQPMQMELAPLTCSLHPSPNKTMIVGIFSSDYITQFSSTQCIMHQVGYPMKCPVYPLFITNLADIPMVYLPILSKLVIHHLHPI